MTLLINPESKHSEQAQLQVTSIELGIQMVVYPVIASNGDISFCGEVVEVDRHGNRTANIVLHTINHSSRAKAVIAVTRALEKKAACYLDFVSAWKNSEDDAAT
jgi:hypothetical protein